MPVTNKRERAPKFDDSKQFWLSKTLWTNAVLAAAVVVQTRWGFVVSADMQALAITLINIILRQITKKPITWR